MTGADDKVVGLADWRAKAQPADVTDEHAAAAQEPGDEAEIEDPACADNNGPVLAGKAMCQSCKATWRGVAPLGVTALQCPKCATFHGVFIGAVTKDEEHYRCRCGNDVFAITRRRVYCAHCGIDHKPWD